MTPPDDFTAQYNAGQAQTVIETLSADVHTPVAVFLRCFAGESDSFLFESVEKGVSRGRYSVLGARPDAVWQTNTPNADALDQLRQMLARDKGVLPAHVPALCAGWFGFLGYDMLHCTEVLPTPAADPLNMPDAYLIRPSILVVFDAVYELLHISAPVYPQPKITAAQAYAAALQRIEQIRARLHAPLPAAIDVPPPVLHNPPPPQSNMTAAQYCAAVEKCRDYIAAGDAFQIVPSQRLSVPYGRSPLDFYRALRRINPSPYMFCFMAKGFSLVGASPEILVRIQGNTMTVRPIAGTRRRGHTPQEDAALEAELRADPKEQAEHLMLLDLGRNDVGRVCTQVHVADAFTIERYSHVMHIVSQVEGTLRPDITPIDAVLAAFPAGTVSGAPKLRAMEIINQLEPHKRAFYAGGLGCFSINGDIDTCITLRTACIKDGVLHVQAGAGVVADSIPQSEYDETLHKAAALLRACVANT
jgi:anthranilate synthase component I